jgi:hypothetical protein
VELVMTVAQALGRPGEVVEVECGHQISQVKQRSSVGVGLCGSGLALMPVS